MKEHIDKWLESWLAGRVSSERERTLETHTRDCDRCTDLYRRMAEDVADVADSLPKVEPSPGLKMRILSDLEPAARFRRFARRTAEFIDVGVDKALELLEGIPDSSNWTSGPAEGVTLYDIEGGPKTADAIVGFIRVDPGKSFPEHKHHGAETVYVLQGELRDSSGDSLRPGDVKVMEPGSSHHLYAGEGPPLIFLAVIDQGVDMHGDFIGPDDPRL